MWKDGVLGVVVFGGFKNNLTRQNVYSLVVRRIKHPWKGQFYRTDSEVLQDSYSMHHVTWTKSDKAALFFSHFNHYIVFGSKLSYFQVWKRVHFEPDTTQWLKVKKVDFFQHIWTNLMLTLARKRVFICKNLPHFAFLV